MQVENQPENPLLAALRRRITEHGPMPFSRFMRSALYDPRHGYYTSGRSVWGVDGDYVTAPRVHPAYGRALARLALEVDDALGRPSRFDLVELGGGDGVLLRTALDAVREEHPDLWRRCRAGMVERGAPARRRARRALPQPGGGTWVREALATDVELRGLVFCNELLDAFPVERVRMREGTLEQSVVDVEEGRLVERFTAPADPRVVEYLRAGGVRMREEQLAEVCLEVEPWLDTVAGALASGALLVVDYGHETSTLYGLERPRGTLVTMRRFSLGDDPLADPGLRDLTAHVDLGNLRRAGGTRGFEVEGPCSLRVFLLGMGAADVVPREPRERLALRHLLVSEIGDAHKAMLLTRGLPAGTPVFGRRRLDSGREPSTGGPRTESDSSGRGC